MKPAGGIVRDSVAIHRLGDVPGPNKLLSWFEGAMRVNETNPELMVVARKERSELGKNSVALDESFICLANVW